MTSVAAGASALADQLAKSGEAVKSGPIGLAVILLLCIACYFLFKSMSKHLRTVREDFPAKDSPTAQPVQRAQPVSPAQLSAAVDLHKPPKDDGSVTPTPLPPAQP